MRVINTTIALSFLLAACGTGSVFQGAASDPKGLEKIGLLMEEGNHEQVKQEVLAQLPESSRLVISNENPEYENLAYAKEVATAVAGAANAAPLVSLYANATAQAVKVDSLSILVKLTEIDEETKSAANKLRLINNNEAIATFFPAMPTECASAEGATVVIDALRRAINLFPAVPLILGTIASDADIAAIFAAEPKSSLLASAIYTQVQFICRVRAIDANSDLCISEEESLAVDSDLADELFDGMTNASRVLSALVINNPSDKNLKRASARIDSYVEKINSSTFATLEEKMRLLLTTTACVP